MWKHNSASTLPPLEIDDDGPTKEFNQNNEEHSTKQPLLPNSNKFNNHSSSSSSTNKEQRSISLSSMNSDESNNDKNNIMIDEIISSSSSSEETTQVPKSNLQKKRKQIINRAKNIPVTQTQKRARWVPGHTYMPFLILQWIWHPIAIFIRSSRKAFGGGSGSSSNHMNDHKLQHDGVHHQHQHNHHHHHNVGHVSAKGSHAGFVLGSTNAGDLFLE